MDWNITLDWNRYRTGILVLSTSKFNEVTRYKCTQIAQRYLSIIYSPIQMERHTYLLSKQQFHFYPARNACNRITITVSQSVYTKAWKVHGHFYVSTFQSG